MRRLRQLEEENDEEGHSRFVARYAMLQDVIRRKF